MGELDEPMCDFDAESLRCTRCGYIAKRLPTYRVCRTIPEMARKIATDTATKRVTVPPLKIGTAVAKGLAAVGITKERVQAITGKDCGCAKRQNALDAAGAVVSGVVERGVNAALNAVLPNPVEQDDIAAIANSLHASPLTNDGLKQGPPVS
jgi:hypothetical protein